MRKRQHKKNDKTKTIKWVLGEGKDREKFVKKYMKQLDTLTEIVELWWRKEYEKKT